MSDTKDMGPFADMAPDLVQAVTRYGTPPIRETVRVTVRDVGNYSFDSLPTTIPEWIVWLEDARMAAPEQYRDSLRCVMGYEPAEYDGSASADLSVWYDRPETDAEMVVRVGRGIAYVQNKANEERRQYEALKAKFG